MKRIVSILLVLAMLLSMLPTLAAFAAQKEGELVDLTAQHPDGKGFLDPEFLQNNDYRYAENEIVRAIVVLEGTPEADVGDANSKRAGQQRRLLLKGHDTILSEMSDIEYSLQYEFTALLNGFSCDIAYGDLEKVASIEGVEAVYIANHYAEPETELPQTEMSTSFTGNAIANDYGYGGQGVRVAVLDTGTRISHEVFTSYFEDSRFYRYVDWYGYSADGVREHIDSYAEAQSYLDLLTKTDISAASVSGSYISAKIPFAYDYADSDNDVADKNSHGTHVAGTAAGFHMDLTDGAVDYLGAAPYAQLLAMKIFKDEGGGTSSDIYFYAMEDAYRLGADVVNMSIGGQNGFTYDSSLETDVFGNIYSRLENAGIILCVSAGNEYSMADYNSNTYGKIPSSYTDYGTVAAPSTYTKNRSIASIENLKYPDYVLTVAGESFIYVDAATASADQWRTKFGGKTVDYVALTDAQGQLACGLAADYSGVNVKNKIVVVSRGSSSFEEKVEAAANAGAAGCIVVNNTSGMISMVIESYEIPAISVAEDQKYLFLNAAKKSIYTSSELEYIDNPDAAKMSSFSCWGTTPDLTIAPSLTSVGGDVYSAGINTDTEYTTKSGTSMAAPNATGTFANVISFLRDYENGLSKASTAQLATDLLYSTANVAPDPNSNPYSVRKQGAGVANSADAINAYKNSAYIRNPLNELGDDVSKSGIYTYEVELVNQADRSIRLSDFRTVITYDYVRQAADCYVNMLTAQSMDDDDTQSVSITYLKNGQPIQTLTLASGETAKVTVRIALTDEFKKELDQKFPNGTFIEGYSFFSDVTDGEIAFVGASSADRFINYIQTYDYMPHNTFLAYYGDWTQGQVAEHTDFGDFVAAQTYIKTTAANSEGKTYADLGYTPYDFVDVTTSPNMAYLLDTANSKLMGYLGGNLVGNADFRYAYAAFSTASSNASHHYADAIYVTPYLLRNVDSLTMTISDKANGTVYFTKNSSYVRKAIYDYEDGWTPTADFVWDGKDKSGKLLPSGTVATVRFDAVLPYRDTQKSNIWSFDVTVDYTAPIIEKVYYNQNNSTLTVLASDEQYLQAVFAADSSGNILDSKVLSPEEKGQSVTVSLDISSTTADSVVVGVIDYATNEQTITVKPSELDAAYIVNFVVPEGVTTPKSVIGSSVTLPTPVGTPKYNFNNATFAGWTTRAVQPTQTTPTIYTAGKTYGISSNITLYAVYTYGSSGTSRTFTLFDGTNQLYINDTIIIVAYGQDYAMSTTQNSTNRGAVAINRSSDGKTITITNEQVALFTLGFGVNGSSESSKISFKDSTGYLYAASSSANSLSTKSTLDANGTWTLNRNNSDSTMNFVAQGSNSRNTMRYDATNRYFACYSSKEQTGVMMYVQTSESTIGAYYTTVFSCSHSSTTLQNASKATCTADGYSGDLVCDICGDMLEKGNLLPSSGHSYRKTVVDVSCTADGYTSYTCTTCGDHYIADEIKSEGHKYNNGIVIKLPTCTADGVKSFTCASCGDIYEETVPALGHDAQTTIVEATCTENGSVKTSCRLCGELLSSQVLEAKGHSYEAVVTKPTCTEAGYTTYTCSACGDHYQADATDALTHNYNEGVVTKAPTCTEEGVMTFTCGNCNASYTQAIAQLGHSYQAIVTAPTCTEAGYTTYRCSACGETYMAEETAALGHSYNDGVVTLAPSCTEAGVTTFTCSACTAAYTEQIAPTGHTEMTVTQAATCTLDGYVLVTCQTCKQAQSYAAIAALGHNYEAAVTAPTCTEAGYTTYSCTACTESYIADETAALGHSYTYTNQGRNHSISCNGCDESKQEAHTYVNGVCLCGATEKIPDSSLTFNMNISVGAEMQVVYTIPIKMVSSYESFCFEISKAAYGAEPVVTTYGFGEGMTELEAVTNASGAVLAYRVTYTGIFAKEMGDVFTATLYTTDANGAVHYSDAKIASIKSYLMEMLNDVGSAETLKTLAVDMLNYGATAQLYFGYDAQNLVNADLTQAHKAYATTTIPSATDKIALSGDGATLISDVSVQNKVMLYLTCAYKGSDESAPIFVIKDAKTGDVIDRRAATKLSAAAWRCTYDEVGAKHMRRLLTIEVYDGDTLISKSLTWSVESYVAKTRANAKTTELELNMVNALLIYGDSAAAYLEN